MKKVVISSSIMCIIICIILSFDFFKVNSKNLIKVEYEKECYNPILSIDKIKEKKHKLDIINELLNQQIGKYSVTYIYKIGNIELKKVRKINVPDKVPPVIELKANKYVTICPNKEYIEDGFTAIDNYDGDITSHVIVEKYDDKIKYYVKDSSGNEDIKYRKIKKEDTIPPNISLKGDSIIYLNKGTKYVEVGVNVEDNCSNNVSISIDGNVDENIEGEYVVNYKAKDSFGNISTISRKVIVEENTGVIYLTFDDGPSGSGSTSKILDVLKKYGIKATFFVTTSGPDYLIKREYEEGHTVALHTSTHNYSYVYSSVNNYFDDLSLVNDRVKRITGIESKIIRFPGGSNNTVSNNYNFNIMSTLKREVLNRGYNYFDWNIDSNDTGVCARANVSDKSYCVYKYVTNSLYRNGRNIVLMHDIKSYTASAIENIIIYAKNSGFKFEAITNSTKPIRFN